MEAKHKIEAYCAYQDRCHFEVNNKLFSWGIDEENRGILISHLIQHRFLDEERFAESFVSGKFRIKKWGRNKIKVHLKQKRVPAYSIKKGLAVIDPEEYWETLIRLTEKKWEATKGKNHYDKVAKVKRFLVGRGFEFDLIHEAIEEVKNRE